LQLLRAPIHLRRNAARAESAAESIRAIPELNRFQLLGEDSLKPSCLHAPGYKVRERFLAIEKIPVESTEADVPELAPGGSAEIGLKFNQTETAQKICCDVTRPI